MGLGSGIRDLGSGKNLFRIPDPGIKKAPDTGSGSATLFSCFLSPFLSALVQYFALMVFVAHLSWESSKVP
jgi:hypothetical protein